MKLLIISAMPHAYRNDKIVGWGATAQEIKYLSRLFSHITHIAPVSDKNAPNNYLEYLSEKIELRAIPPAGGAALRDKVRILFLLPQYIRTIIKEIKNSDVVQVRCPANISLVAIVILAFIKNTKKRWIKYAGSWQSYSGESLSYKLQKWWLMKNFARSAVTINGEWANQPEHVHSFFNPCLEKKEIEEAKLFLRNKFLAEPVQFVFVGRIEEAKGIGRVLQILSLLKQRNIQFSADLIGDGPKSSYYRDQSEKLKLPIAFHGWLPKSDLRKFYAKAHFLLIPSSGEGWPKVISEAMAYGVLPIASSAGAISQYLNKFKIGKALSIDDPANYFDVFLTYFKNPQVWKEESNKAHEFSPLFSYENYLSNVRGLLNL